MDYNGGAPSQTLGTKAGSADDGEGVDPEKFSVGKHHRVDLHGPTVSLGKGTLGTTIPCVIC